MEAALVRLIDRTPQWIINIGALVVILGLLYVVISWSRAASRLTMLLGRDERLLELADRVQALDQERNQYQVTAVQLQATIRQVRQFLVEYRVIKEESIDHPADLGERLRELLSRLVERLPLDIKSLSGEAHRSGIWVVDWDRRKLVLTWASTGFPVDYKDRRTLDLDHSIAGRAVRKGTTEVVDDVVRDPDYSPPQYKHDYRALICIPIAYRDHVGAVLTTDAKHPFSELQVDICHAYAGLMELDLGEYADSLPTPLARGGGAS